MKILLVEDDQLLQLSWSDALRGRARIISALSIPEAEQRFLEHPDIAVIVMDACVPGSIINTPPLVARLRANFFGPMIANSSHAPYCRELIQAGCDHECPKHLVIEKLHEVILSHSCLRLMP